MAEAPEEACQIAVNLLSFAQARLVAKSMVAEEIGLNAALEASGFSVIETDLGEYIIQIRGRRPHVLCQPFMS